MNLQEALQKIGADIIKDARTALKKKNDTGTLSKSLKAVINGNDLTFDMEDYGFNVDMGREPGSYVPINSLKSWCKRKGMNSSAAYAINNNIYKYGIKPSYFFTNTFENYSSELDNIIDKYVDNLLEDL